MSASMMINVKDWYCGLSEGIVPFYLCMKYTLVTGMAKLTRPTFERRKILGLIRSEIPNMISHYTKDS